MKDKIIKLIVDIIVNVISIFLNKAYKNLQNNIENHNVEDDKTKEVINKKTNTFYKLLLYKKQLEKNNNK